MQQTEMQRTGKPTVIALGGVLDRDQVRWDTHFTVHSFAGCDEADLRGDTASARALVSFDGRVTSDLLDRLPALELVVCFASGYGAVDLASLRARGLRLAAGGGVNAGDVADHAWALALAAWHGLVRADAATRAGLWRQGQRLRPSLAGRTAGIVGLGRIGIAVARRAEAFGMKVAWWGPTPRSARWPCAATLADLASVSDLLFVCARDGAATRQLIDGPVLDALGSDGLLVNVSRGNVVDQQALFDRLGDGRLGGAALDVFDPEPPEPEPRWTDLANLVVSPHLAGFTREGAKALRDRLFDNVDAFFRGVPLPSEIDLRS